jgi:hypothetical protein
MPAPASGVSLGLPESVVSLIQTNLIERAFHDALYPALLFRQEAVWEEWEGNAGQDIFMTRAGLMDAITAPIAAGTDPIPQSVPYEQWQAVLARYAGTLDIHMPTSAVAASDLFLRNIQQLGLQAGQSINRLARNALFKSYLSGQTTLKVLAGSGDTTISVSSLNGFRYVVLPGVRPTPVSTATPLQVTIGSGGTAVTRNVIAATPDDVSNPDGPGVLTLSAAVGGSGQAVRAAVISKYAPSVIRSGGGDSVDSLGASDLFVLQDVMNAVAVLRSNNVPPHTDGYYHAHLSPEMNAQVFADPVFQRLYTALPQSMAYREGFIGTIGQVAFFLNTETPTSANVGSLVATGGYAQFGSDVGAEIVNEANLKVGRCIVTGRGVLIEKGFDENKYISEAGVLGKLGAFSVMNNCVAVAMERIRLYLRPPVDRLGDTVAASWSISTSFPVPSDLNAKVASNALYKRAIVIESAVG